MSWIANSKENTLAMRKSDKFGGLLGILVFLGGIALLVFVFMSAHGMFVSREMGLQVTSQKAIAAGAVNQLGPSAVRLFARIGLLLLMCIVSSLIASKGISLYFASTSVKHPPTIEDAKEDA